MPVRIPTNRRGRNIVGKFPSLKLGRMVAFESTIERDYIYLLEFDRKVVFFEEQPLTIEYKFEDRQHKYTPDFKVVDASGRHLLVDCKPLAYVDTDDNKRKFAAATQWCVDQNWEFQVIIDQDIRAGHRLDNIKMLWQFARYNVSPDINARIIAALNSTVPLTLDELTAQVAPNNPRSATIPILHMMFHHQLRTLIDETKITGNSPIYLPVAKEVVS